MPQKMLGFAPEFQTLKNKFLTSRLSLIPDL